MGSLLQRDTYICSSHMEGDQPTPELRSPPTFSAKLFVKMALPSTPTSDERAYIAPAFTTTTRHWVGAWKSRYERYMRGARRGSHTNKGAAGAAKMDYEITLHSKDDIGVDPLS